MIIIFKGHQVELRATASNPEFLCAPNLEIEVFLKEFKLPIINSENGQITIRRSDLLLLLSSLAFRETNNL
jgi:hypothetical protein